MFRSSCLPKQLEAEWHFGGVKYRYGGKKEGKLRRLVASYKFCLPNLRFVLANTPSVTLGYDRYLSNYRSGLWTEPN